MNKETLQAISNTAHSINVANGFNEAEIYDFDLEWHIDAKLTYNKTRSHLHGKAY